jgi:hypothetical protein
MIPFLTYPLALMAMASLPALAAIYILRNRFRRQTVSSLMLWRFRVQSKEGGAKVNRIQLPLVFFLELLALVLLATAATGPRWKLPQSTRPLLVILDDSFSMRAVKDNASAQARAREYLRTLFRHQAPPVTRLLLAGQEPRLLGSPARTWAEVEKLLPQWTCHAPSTALEAALTLASELGKQQANLLVLTDHPPPEKKVAGDRVEWHSFGEPLDNAAFINASRTALGDQDRCLLEIANFSTKPHEARVVVQAGANMVQRALLSLAPQEHQRVVFNVPSSTALLIATLDDDALAEDNQVQLAPPVRKKVRVQVLLANDTLNSLAERALDATGLRAALSQNPELVIQQSDLIPSGSNVWSLNWVVAANATAYTGPFVIDTSHPLGEGLGLQGAVWAATSATNAPGFVPVVLAGNVPLLSVHEDALARRHFTLNLDPALSTVQNTPDWPILFWNLLQWRASELPGLEDSNIRLGTEAILKTTGEAVTVNWPDGSVKAFAKTTDRLSLETPLPGLYTIKMGPATSSCSVNTLAAEKSDLAGCQTGQWGKWGEDAEHRFEETSLIWTFGLAALLVLVSHLWVLSTGKGGN